MNCRFNLLVLIIILSFVWERNLIYLLLRQPRSFAQFKCFCGFGDFPEARVSETYWNALTAREKLLTNFEILKNDYKLEVDLSLDVAADLYFRQYCKCFAIILINSAIDNIDFISYLG